MIGSDAPRALLRFFFSAVIVSDRGVPPPSQQARRGGAIVGDKLRDSESHSKPTQHGWTTIISPWGSARIKTVLAMPGARCLRWRQRDWLGGRVSANLKACRKR